MKNARTWEDTTKILDDLDELKNKHSFSADSYHTCEQAYLLILDLEEKQLEMEAKNAVLAVALGLSCAVVAGLTSVVFLTQGFI